MAGLKNVTTSDGKGVASNGTTAADLYTAPASLKDAGQNSSPGYGAWLQSMRVYNSDTVQHDCVFHNLPSGLSIGNDTIFERVTIPAGASYRWQGKEWLGPSAKVQIKLGEAHTSTAVYTRPQVVEST